MNIPEELEQEVRFAVVIYGGVSLAVYINGVVQEMLHMVRATAGDAPEPSHSERVYRKLACITGCQPDPEGGEERRTIHGRVADNGLAEPDEERVRSKFVVDILSGTSAGGINAIYLAKALARNQPLLELAMMWIHVADITKLLNDSASAEVPVKPQVPPKSLLNSRWMYLKLLQALDGMETTTEGEAKSLVEDLDLFATATDLDGVALPIALADQQVLEFRHRNVFHFQKRGDGQNDFTPDITPFLAYCARCTSAFPFAFEPMALCDAYDVFPYLEPHRRQPYCNDKSEYWQRFYLDYLRDADPNVSTPFALRSFGDGGYLDNKPFSYAIDTIMQRHADLPVDRKLIYVEPSPEDIGKQEKKRKSPADRPDAIENSLAALIDLPRYETIREDLLRVLDWNRNVARIRRVVRGAGVARWPDAEIENHRRSPAYRFYLRLRLSSVTDRVASAVAEALQVDPSSARGDAIRGLAGAWRELHHPDDAQQLAFLAAYDLEYLERAVRFLRVRLRRTGDRKQMAEVAQARKRLRALDVRPLPDLQNDPAAPLNAEQLKALETQRNQEFRFAVDPQFAAQEPFANPLIPKEAMRDTDAGFQCRLRYLLDHRGWNDAISMADEQLRRHFGELALIRTSLDSLMALPEAGGWARFDGHDSLVFPIVFGTKLGETDPIDIVRISPADAADISGVDDGRDTAEPRLKGQKYGAFGGFFDRRWRLHDMLRGRLHAAERLITAVLSSSEPEVVKLREALIVEAQTEIARDWQETFEQFLQGEESSHATA